MVALLPQYAEAERLEQILGDPGRADNTLSFAQAARLDEAELLPQAALDLLHGHAMHHHYVPAGLGGRFGGCEEFVSLGRVLARRDMNVAASYSTLLWTMLAWIGGSPAQQQRVAAAVLDRGVFPCLAYSEAEHGAALAENRLAARPHAGGYVVRGEKWPINRATQSGMVVLLARTGAADGVRSQSLFIVEKAELDAARHYHLPRVKTHGLRGCDISGVGFRDCVVPATARVGEEGEGLELALKGFQVTRTFCASLSLGAGDTMLRSVANFLSARRLYGAPAIALPHAREVLANAYLSLLVGECAAVVGARGLHLHVDQFSVWSSVVKVQVAALAEHAAQALAGVMGARYYMREQHQDGIFQKMLRDGAVVSLFDGNSIVCLDSLASQLPLLARQRARRQPEADWSPLYDLRAPLEPFRPERLALFGRGRDAVTASLPHLLAMLQQIAPSAWISEARLHDLRAAAARLAARLEALECEAAEQRPPLGEPMPAGRFALAETYCALHTAIACLGVWLFNRDYLGEFFADGAWLLAALRRLGVSRFETGSLAPETADALCRQMLAQRRDGHLFSLLSIRLATEGQRESLAPPARRAAA